MAGWMDIRVENNKLQNRHECGIMTVLLADAKSRIKVEKHAEKKQPGS